MNTYLIQRMDCQKYYNTVGELGSNLADKIRYGRTLDHIDKAGTLIDVGCGEGYWLELLSKRTQLRLSGSDVSPVRLNIAKENLSGKDISLKVADILHLPFGEGSFDQVTALEVLEHLPNWQDGLNELSRIASKKVIATVPYGETLKYQDCSNCGTTASLSGHLHSFTEDTFTGIGINGGVSLYKIPAPFNFGHYIKKKIKKYLKLLKNNEKPLTIICPSCYEVSPYKKQMEGKIHRLKKIIKKAPEHLLVKIDI